ncbi:antitoxin VbhA family protein [Massilia solisilvae]|uniref:Antitoxin VbhA family protein n=1 Tax=Massilia solisilvae TaxID=1811225 RepID=A0ABT2BNJ0_9BURK|nr:antitoxin VbhA family protein [Massilia solisilvae]MCS0610040.1 antitoxin VbhA family protein [Massilia solisilvae]
MSKAVEELILGAGFQEGARQAVDEAVARADSAGLPPAYEPQFSMERRRNDVMQMNAIFELSGFTPDGQDLENQRRYILGELTLNDLLAHAQAFARAHQPTNSDDQPVTR